MNMNFFIKLGRIFIGIFGFSLLVACGTTIQNTYVTTIINPVLPYQLENTTTSKQVFQPLNPCSGRWHGIGDGYACYPKP
jgi:hypothetical protein